MITGEMTSLLQENNQDQMSNQILVINQKTSQKNG
jgi:hypothetical protein